MIIKRLYTDHKIECHLKSYLVWEKHTKLETKKRSKLWKSAMHWHNFQLTRATISTLLFALIAAPCRINRKRLFINGTVEKSYQNKYTQKWHRSKYKIVTPNYRWMLQMAQHAKHDKQLRKTVLCANKGDKPHLIRLKLEQNPFHIGGIAIVFSDFVDSLA